MKVECFADKKFPNDWRVEAINEEGGCFVTIFSGPDAKKRAKEYAAWWKPQVETISETKS